LASLDAACFSGATDTLMSMDKIPASPALR
jgi:hypothetical protein